MRNSVLGIGVVYRCIGARTAIGVSVYRCEKHLADPNPQRCSLHMLLPTTTNPERPVTKGW